MKKIISLLLLVGAVSVNAASIELKIQKQKVNSNGIPYGSPGGIYFKCTDIDPFILYTVQYSRDLKTWTDLYNFGAVGTQTTSPLFHWYQLPPNKCFFRIVVAW
jgi:hypothetical protein